MSATSDVEQTTVASKTSNRNSYWRYYGLKRDPFISGIRDDQEFYLPPRWEQHFDLLHYLCRSSNVMLTLSGVKGSGKTTFLRYFIQHTGEAVRVCQLLGSPLLSTEQLCAALVKNFALPIVDEGTLEERLDSYIANIQHSEKVCLLVIDNAHRLPTEAFRTLLYLVQHQSENQMRLHILLAGEPSFKNALYSLLGQAKEHELLHSLALEPLELAETKNYVRQRMVAAGLPAAVPLSQGSLTRIHKLSEGIPGRINVVARQALIDATAQKSLATISNLVGISKTQLIGGAIIMVLLAIAGLFITAILHRASHLHPKITPTPQQSIPQIQAPPHFVAPPLQIPVTPPPKPVPLKPASDLNLVASLPAASMTPRAATPVQKQKTVKSVIKPLTRVEPIKPIVTPKEGYTLQLVGLSTSTAVKKFITENHLQNKVHVVHTQRQGKDWYMLMYGQYPTAAAASHAKQTLPTNLQALHPWVRNISEKKSSLAFDQKN